MGLLKKNRPTSILTSKNPTGLATRDSDVPYSPSASSLIAAQAAAKTFNPQYTSNNSSKPQITSTTQTTHKQPVRPTSVKLASPTYKTNTHQKRNSVILPTSNIYLDNLSASDVETYNHRSSLRSNNRGRSDKRNSITNIASLQAANVATTRSLSSDFLVPPPPIIIPATRSSSKNSRNQSSSRSGSVISSVPSVHSFESLPLFDKLKLMDSNFDNNNNAKSASTDNFKGFDSADELNSNEFQGFDSTTYNEEDDELSEYDSAHAYDSEDDKSDASSFEPKQLSPVHELSPRIIDDELDNESDPLYKSSMVPPPLPVRTSSVFVRKPPPSSPPPQQIVASTSAQMTPSASDSSYISTVNGGQDSTQGRRGLSPRRKPPPDLMRRQSDSAASLSYGYDSTNHSHESLPQYPLTVKELKKSKDIDRKHSKDHRRLSSHGFRKGAKKIIKKGLKVTDQIIPTNNSDVDLPVVKPKPVQLKTTMRKEKKPKFNEDKPWKQHHIEGEFLTEQERKRYEGVWVSNKGLYMDKIDAHYLKPLEDDDKTNPALRASMLSTNNNDLQTLESNLMLNLVVKELWGRSNLPTERLREIWDLVDVDRKDGTLDKKGFIVGMWLVDQSLYGRKLPRVVDDQVWDSVGHMGVNVVIKSKRKK